MNKKEMKLFKFCNELIDTFNNYVIILDAYFSSPNNQEENEFLYEEYKELGKKLKILEEKYRK